VVRFILCYSRDYSGRNGALPCPAGLWRAPFPSWDRWESFPERGLAIILARSLQLGDLDGQLRHALSRFPIPEVAARVLEKYFVPGGKSPSASFKLAAMPTLRPGPALVELTVLANFVEVFLAKDGHGGLVGINYLEKIQLPTLPSLYGAMLADVDYVLMGAGIPRAIPGALDRLAQGEPAQLKIDVIGALPGEEFLSTSTRAPFSTASRPF